MASSTAVSILKRVPVIVVLGATGTGKSKLAIEIATRYGGEIISADSMQVYQGLDIITNKVSGSERDLATHHLIDCVSPLARFTVLDFRRRALPIVDHLLDHQRVPVIVGGTNYYIESLLWKVLFDDDNAHQQILVYDRDELLSNRNQKEATSSHTDIPPDLVFTQDGLDHLTTAQLHQMLQQVDPDMAAVLHPKNRRKIIRSLQAWQQHGRPHSELLKAQCEQEGGSTLGGPLRYSNTLIFWLQCQQDILDQRLDDRVDEMILRGLVSELDSFHNMYNQQRIQDNKEADYTKGIFQSIGFKEFHRYLVLPPDERQTNTGQRLLSEGIQSLKTVTRRYARLQLKWIRNRFLKQPDRQVPPLYALDATDVSQWNSRVRDIAFHIVDAYRDQRESVYRPLPVEISQREDQISFHCHVCGMTMIGRTQWETHLQGSRHRKRVKKQKFSNRTSANQV